MEEGVLTNHLRLLQCEAAWDLDRRQGGEVGELRVREWLVSEKEIRSA